MANTAYLKTLRTGGTSAALDGVDINLLNDGDPAFVVVEVSAGVFVMEFYNYDASSTAAENTTTHPFSVRPDNYATAGVWIETQASTLVPSDGQIIFPATQNASSGANTLDDYEEGTWTPGISFSDGVVGITYSAQDGRYEKIGRTVVATGRLALASKGSSVGNAAVTGLPFVCVNSDGGISPVGLRMTAVAFANVYLGQVQKNTTTILLRECTEAGAETNLTNADFSDTSIVVVTATYEATS
ncbi:MAG: hypothetical protein WC331_10485 [Candidatus Omnitrophota bacterium]|jgi:hypothetical protein